MKKFFVMALAAVALTACSGQKKAADSDSTALQTTDSITAGHFEVHEYDGYKLHIYLTDDQMADASFIIEGIDSIVTLEQPLFRVNAEEYDKYLANLGKPVSTRISDFHLGNTGDAVTVMPEGMPLTVKGPAYSGMMKHFQEQYGDSIVDLPSGKMEEVAFDKNVDFAGVPFKFYKGAACDFPAANILIGTDVVYMHWAPAKTHVNNLYAGNIEAVNARIAELEEMISTGANLFVGGHGTPATTEDADFRVEYLKKVKELKANQPDAKAFAAALIEAYPGLPGEEGVAAFAESLYAK